MEFNGTTLSVAEQVRERHGVAAPRATYRLQFNHTFTFRDAIQIVPYLAELGVSHVYASPLFAAATGSMHGYDVVDYAAINPEIGTEEDFSQFVQSLHAHDLRLIVDFVPNHMGIENGQNAWWQDVLEHGEWSPFAEYFDIDWSPLKRELRGKVLLPILGGQYGDVLEGGELKLVFRDDALVVDYWDTPLPITPGSYPIVLNEAATSMRSGLDPEDIDLLELESISAACERLDDVFDQAVDHIEARRRESLVIKHRLATLLERSQAVAAAVNTAVERFNGRPGDQSSYDLIDQLLDQQCYRLAFWKVASEEINYRRFFAINSLAAIRQEETDVFEASHALLLRLCAEGKIDGVRIDHPDGLWDPARYFRQLQFAYLKIRGGPGTSDRDIDTELDRIAAGAGSWPLYVVGEKILEHGESLPENWALAGTVGYEFAQTVTGLFVDPSARVLFDRIFTRFTGDRIRFPDLVYEMKQRMMREAFASEINVLTNLLNRISEQDRHSRDFTLNSLRNVLREVIAGFSIYRTYSTCVDEGIDDRDRRYIDSALAFARKRNPVLDATVFDFVGSVLKLHATDQQTARMDAKCHFAMKLQQLTGPVMAKALEDTAFYRFNRLVSLNEVGGDPGKFGSGADEFHRQNRARLKTWPEAMLTSSTHDTKRSEDVRARISVLSEVPAEWRAALNRWTRLNRKLKQLIDGALAPHRADEYVIYQTLIGTWPLEGLTSSNRSDYQRRMTEYIIKVAREATRFTNWVNPDEAYEAALTSFVSGLLNERRSRGFIRDFEEFAGGIRQAGFANGLTQQLLKLTSPGVPDIYQGTEIWDDSLVDPDNRRPVDFATRSKMLNQTPDVASGSLKLHLTQTILAARAQRPRLFDAGDYVSLSVIGPQADRVVAFARILDDDVVVTIAGRLLHVSGDVFHQGDFWKDTTVELPVSLEGRILHERLDSGDAESRIDLERAFAKQPFAFYTSWSQGDR